MKLITFENSAYQVSDKEWKKLCDMQKKASEAEYPKSHQLEVELSQYLDKNISKYKSLGYVMFDFRI